MFKNNATKIAVLTAVLVVIGGSLASEVQAATKTKTVKKKAVATKLVKAKTVKIATVKAVPDEEIVEPVTKCLIKTIIDLNAKAQKQLSADIAKFGKGHEKIVERYQYRIDMAWQAMNDPYCGYGQKTGLGDEIHSFRKSVDRARGDFLAEAKR